MSFETSLTLSCFVFGFAGCYARGSGALALTGNSWRPTEPLTVESCINGCSELNFTMAGLDGGNRKPELAVSAMRSLMMTDFVQFNLDWFFRMLLWQPICGRSGSPCKPVSACVSR
jgi:hypothetical protein